MEPVEQRRPCGATTCSAPARKGGRYCLGCHAKAQKAYRDRQVQKRRTEAWERSRARLALETAAWAERLGS